MPPTRVSDWCCHRGLRRTRSCTRARSERAKRNYDMGNWELFTVKLVLEEWRNWLEGAELPFIVWTDHRNLEFIRTAKRLNSRQARWSVFHFNFIHPTAQGHATARQTPFLGSSQGGGQTPWEDPGKYTSLPMYCGSSHLGNRGEFGGRLAVNLDLAPAPTTGSGQRSWSGPLCPSWPATQEHVRRWVCWSRGFDSPPWGSMSRN